MLIRLRSINQGSIVVIKERSRMEGRKLVRRLVGMVAVVIIGVINLISVTTILLRVIVLGFASGSSRMKLMVWSSWRVGIIIFLMES